MDMLPETYRITPGYDSVKAKEHADRALFAEMKRLTHIYEDQHILDFRSRKKPFRVNAT